jgi:hypothetical protein
VSAQAQHISHLERAVEEGKGQEQAQTQQQDALPPPYEDPAVWCVEAASAAVSSTFGGAVDRLVVEVGPTASANAHAAAGAAAATASSPVPPVRLDHGDADIDIAGNDHNDTLTGNEKAKEPVLL